MANCKRDEIKSELKDIKNRRNDLAHGSISFAEASNQVTTSELAELVNHVDSFFDAAPQGCFDLSQRR